LAGLGAAAPLEAFLHVEGQLLFVAARSLAADSPLVIAAVRLSEDGGVLSGSLLSGLELGNADLLTRLLVSGSRAYVSAFPSGVLTVDVTDAAAISALPAASVDIGSGPGDGVVDVAWLAAPGAGRVVVVSQEESASTTASARV